MGAQAAGNRAMARGQMAPTSPAGLRELLDAAGYRVVFRAGHDGGSPPANPPGPAGVECLVHRDHERWFGRGATEEEALQVAAAQMFPSSFARELLARRMAQPPAPREETTLIPAPPAPAPPAPA